MKKMLAVIILTLVTVYALAQMPTVQCPTHNVPAYFTGQVRYANSRPVGCEYRHDSHTFWTSCN